VKAIEFTVLGVPAPKGSARAAGNRVIPSGSPANREALVAWGQAMRGTARDAVMRHNIRRGLPPETIPFMGVPLRIKIEFRMPRPLGHIVRKGADAGTVKLTAPKWHTTKPDVSKLLRSTEDELSGLVMDDDARFSEELIRKIYAMPGREGAWIRIEQLEVP
jgi:Holliday junction resolvase RusA-like endonuclease